MDHITITRRLNETRLSVIDKIKKSLERIPSVYKVVVAICAGFVLLFIYIPTDQTIRTPNNQRVTNSAVQQSNGSLSNVPHHEKKQFKRLVCKFDEDVPFKNPKNGKNWWKQGYFPFGNQSRLSTVTGVVFLNRDTLMVSHRAAAKNYVVDISSGKCKIIKTEMMKSNGKYHHPDAAFHFKNKVYFSEFTKQGAVVNEDLSFEKTFTVAKNSAFHGVFVDETGQYFGSAWHNNRNNSVILRDFSGNMNEIRLIHYLKINLRIKALSRFENSNLWILGVDGKDRQVRKSRDDVFDSWIQLYSLENGKLQMIHSIELKNSQIDGVTIHKNYFFATVHSADDQTGYIMVGQKDGNEFQIINRVKVDNFPRGIDCFEDKIAWTHYSPRNSVVVQQLDDLILI